MYSWYVTTMGGSEKMVKPLENKFRLIVVGMDGFYDGSSDFISFSDEVKQIEDYIINNYHGKIDGAYCLSQGALLLIEVLTRNKIEIEQAVLDGTYVAHQGILAGYFTYHVLNYFKHHRDNPPKIMLVGLKLMGLDKEKGKVAYKC